MQTLINSINISTIADYVIITRDKKLFNNEKISSVVLTEYIVLEVTTVLKQKRGYFLEVLG